MTQKRWSYGATPIRNGCRRSCDTAAGQPALHTVSAYLTEAGLVLGETKTDVKSNEITAIPELLRLLDFARRGDHDRRDGMSDRNCQ
jgi:hypothetical protein